MNFLTDYIFKKKIQKKSVLVPNSLLLSDWACTLKKSEFFWKISVCGARYKTRPGLTYHYGHSHKEGASDENSRESIAPTTSSASPQLVGGGVGVNTGGPPMLTMGVAAGPTPSGGGIIQSNLMGEPMPPVPPPGQGPPIPGHVYQDSYVSFLSHPAGTALFLFLLFFFFWSVKILCMSS